MISELILGTIRVQCTVYSIIWFGLFRHQSLYKENGGLLFVYCLFIVCLLFVYCLFIVCLLYVYCLFIVCLLFVYCLFIVCLLFVYCLFIVYLLFVYCLFTPIVDCWPLTI